MVDLDFHPIPGFEPDGRFPCHAHAGGGSRENDGAVRQRGAAAEEGDQLRDAEDEILGVRVLHDFTVQIGADAEPGGVLDLIPGDQARTQRGEGVEGLATAPLGTAPLVLPVPRTHIVGAGVTEHMVEGIFLADVLTPAADHHRQLAFVIHLVTPQGPGQDDRIIGILDGPGGLHEDDGKLGQGHPAFLGMFPVIQADAVEERGVDRGENFGHLGLAGGGLKLPQGVTGDLVDAFFGLIKPVTDFSPGVQITDDLHGLGWEGTGPRLHLFPKKTIDF